jgi:chemotaxis protein CheX
MPAPPEHVDPAFAAAVHYQGAWRGSLVLECNEQQARSWAQALMSLPSVEDNDARDALAEIANVLAGNLKSVFPSGAVLSMPAVVAPPSPDMNQGATSEKAYFADQSGVFSVTFVDAG